MSTGSVTDVNPTPALNYVDPSEAGFNALKAEDFMKLLIVELQNQDPTEPVKNQDLLSQLSAMQALTSNTQLQETLTEITAAQTQLAEAQSLTNAATLIGRQITSETYEGVPVEGIVDRAFMKDGEVFVGVGSLEVPLSKVNRIDLAA